MTPLESLYIDNINTYFPIQCDAILFLCINSLMKGTEQNLKKHWSEKFAVKIKV